MKTDILLFIFLIIAGVVSKHKFIFKVFEIFVANKNSALIFLKLRCSNVFYMTLMLINVMQKLQFPAESELLTF